MSDNAALAGALLIDGQWRNGSGAAFSSLNPATETSVWRGNAAAPGDIDAALAAARRASPAWACRPFVEREAIVRAFAAQLQTHKEKLADIIGRETGKPLWDARGEVAAMTAKIDISVHAWHMRTGKSETRVGKLNQVLRHRPHGVVAVFGPYNFPGHLPNGHIVPALLAGNCVVFKPSELTPLVAEETAKLWLAAGIPPGVFTLLQGERDTGAALAAHAELDGLYFTGSARTGRILARQFAETPQKILALELGGNNPMIVGDVADSRAALHDVVQSAYLSSGQRCTCARRLFVKHDAAGDDFVRSLANIVGSLTLGAHDADPQPYMGPLISRQAADGLLAAQAGLIERGAKPLVEMRRHALGAAFVTPGLLDVANVAELPDEEYFGPLLQVDRYATLDEAIDKANRTRYGLSAALLSDSHADYESFYHRIRAGIVNWNRQTTGASSAAPFGGIGASGNHRPSAFYAADYCAYPVASMEAPHCELPASLSPGLKL
ncbi:MAG: succinylglutamic semialdehyde dehydrogenase [Nevskia sp.]|nr:succinylglutamic semialdehyde dehydrogenase [Nevskia sp.]